MVGGGLGRYIYLAQKDEKPENGSPANELVVVIGGELGAVHGSLLFTQLGGLSLASPVTLVRGTDDKTLS